MISSVRSHDREGQNLQRKFIKITRQSVEHTTSQALNRESEVCNYVRLLK